MSMPESFRRQLEAAGQLDDMAAIPERPQLMTGLDFYYDAFFQLGTTRQIGFGVSFISWLNIQQFAMMCELDTIQTYFLHRVVATLDPIYVEHVSRESRRNQNSHNARSVS